MCCSKCGKEITDDSKFCEHCGNKITEINSKNRLIIDKKIILLIVFIIIGIVITCIGIFIYNNDKNFTINSINTSSQDTKTNVIIEDLLVQENNGYKTFNFTIDDVINAYSMKEEEVFFSKSSAFCETYIGTTSAILIPDNRILTEQEKYLSEIIIIYEDVSRKIISINTPVTTMKIVSFLTDNNMELTDNWGEAVKNQAYENMLLLLNRVNRKFKNIDVLGDVTNSKYIYSSNDIIYGRYKMIEKNIGLIQCVIEEPIGLDLIIIAVDEEEFYNSTINVLLDVTYSNLQKEETNITESDVLNDSSNQQTDITAINGKYPNVQIVDGDNKDNQIIEENPNSDNEPVTFSMLYLLGYSEESAISLLEASGLKANIVYSSDTEARYGTVISQSINPDEPVKEGETITITISNRVKESELTLVIWLSYLVPKDTDTANVTIIINGEIVMDKNVTLKKNVTSDANNLTENFYVSNETQVQVLVNGKIVYTYTKDFGVNGDCDFREEITDFSLTNIMEE